LKEKRISKDKRRYWRILCDDGKPFLLYLDMSEIVYKYRVVHLLGGEYSAYFAIVPIVIIPPKLR